MVRGPSGAPGDARLVERHGLAVVDPAPELGVCASDEDVVLDCGRAAEAVLRRGPAGGELPVATLIRAGKPAEDLDPLLERRPGQLLGRAGDVHGARGTDGGRGAVDHNRDLLPRLQ